MIGPVAWFPWEQGLARSCLNCGRPFIGRAQCCSEKCRQVQAYLGRRVTCECGHQHKGRFARCWRCKRDERWDAIETLWRTGIPMRQMVKDPRVNRANVNSLGVEMARMKKAGRDLPYRRSGWGKK